MSVFLADISSFEHGLKVADLTDCVGILAKCTEGTYYTDADYAGWRQQAKAAGKLFVAYHFISGEDPAAQAAHLAAHIGDTSLPVMLDWEPEGTYKPSLAQLLAVADAVNARGMRTRLAYVPRWYWAQIGGPDLSGLTARRLGMISSAYPGASGTATQLYPGDGAAGWQPYGNDTPMFYQFTNQAADGGQRIDMNAYKGSAVALAAFLGQSVPTPSTGGTDVTPQEIHDVAAAVYAFGTEDVTIGGTVMHNTPLGNLAHGAWASTNDPKGPVLSQLTAIRSQLDALAARPAPAPAPVDVNALSAALAPLLQGFSAPSPDEVALAVVAHLGLDVSVVAK